MPELPDVVVYREAIERFAVGHRLDAVRLRSPFLVRTFDPPVAETAGRVLRGVERLGKRLVLRFDGDRFWVVHLMVTGRLRWRARGAGLPGRIGLLAADFDHGTLLLTEAGRRKRASLHVVDGRAGLVDHDPGGLDVLTCTAGEFAARLRAHNHTLKRALTDPRRFDGIGNAYSDEILHRARLSPLQWTTRTGDAEAARLHAGARAVLAEWIERLRAATGDGFPERVTAFRPGMAVHGRAGEPCPVCGEPVQRLVRAESEVNYCARCQTGGRVYADRALSRLLKGDWPRTLEEWEEHREARRGPDGVV